MGKDKDPRLMTSLSLRAERVRLKREIKRLEKEVDQSAVQLQITQLKKRRSVLKTELHRRHLEREAAEQVASKQEFGQSLVTPTAPTLVPTECSQLFLTADGEPYNP